MFIGTHVPTLPTGAPEISDKLLHYLAYGGLAFLLAADQAVRGLWSLRRGFWLLVALPIYGALDELLQIPVGRTADIHDWFADLFGATCGLAAFSIYAFIRPFRSEDEGPSRMESP